MRFTPPQPLEHNPAPFLCQSATLLGVACALAQMACAGRFRNGGRRTCKRFLPTRE